MTALNELTVDELIANFELLGDWEERFGYLLDLGRKVPRMNEADLTDEHKVHGCQSQVWLKAELDRGDPPRLQFIANSDAHIVNGLIAILMTIYNGKAPEQVVETDAAEVLRALDLEEHLSPTRRNGLHAMVARIRELAQQAAAASN